MRTFFSFVCVGINGANNEETTKIDILIATMEDILDPLRRILFYEQDEEKKV